MYSSGILNRLTTIIEKVYPLAIRDFVELERMQSSQLSRNRFVDNTVKNITEKYNYFASKLFPDSLILANTVQNYEQVTGNSIVYCPISGRTNLSSGIPFVASAISVYSDGKQQAAAILDIVRNDYYRVESGSNAITRRQKLRVSRRTSLIGSIIACDHISYGLFNQLSCIRRVTGSVLLDLAFLSAGKYDVVMYQNVSYCDFEAGLMMVKNSGGFVKYVAKQDNVYTIIAACSMKIFAELEKHLYQL